MFYALFFSTSVRLGERSASVQLMLIGRVQPSTESLTALSALMAHSRDAARATESLAWKNGAFLQASRWL
jgi:hypothetical protein